MKFIVLALTAVLLSLAPCAAAQSLFHPDLVEATARLDAARGPEAYAALRLIWGAWDRANPTHVEEALRAAAQDRRLSPATRVYAGLLAAYARTRRGDLTAARAQIGQLGYVDRWLVVGPFDNEGKAGLKLEFGPEFDFDKPIVTERAYTGKERPVRWRQAPLRFPYGWLDAGALVRPDENVCVFATTFVRAAEGSRAKRKITAWVGAQGAFKLYFNGELRLSDQAYRGHDSDRYGVTLQLRAGTNNLTLKLCGDEDPPVASLRLADGRGAPDPQLEYSNSIEDSQAAAKLVASLTAEKGEPKPDQPAEVPDPGKVLGPMQAFERRVAGDQPAADDLSAFAEYLVFTGGDDPTEHQARDLARRAADREPTVRRLLLAGALTEDRNQEGEWVAKAVAHSEQAGEPNIEVLLAQARLARTGVNWRDAFPYFDDVLALDPDNIVAIQGRVEMYNEAGLRRTALGTLQRALDRSPHSVNLLNMVATQLHALGRSTEASEVEERYAALRFDDRAFLGAKIDLALARRDRTSAERWVERLLAVDPDSHWALGVAAQAYRALGQSERAIATYQQALGLAPEDVGTLRALADLHGELGATDQQLQLLRRVLEIRPQDKEVREYVEHIEPPKARPDEAYAWQPPRFLPLRTRPAQGQNRRTLRDLTVSTVFPNGLSRQFRQVVFQPLTDEAAAAGREYVFAYQADRQVVELRGARVYRKDGSVDEAIESGTGPADNPAINMYSSVRTFYVRLPRLEPGDVVELRYRIDDVTPRNEMADYFGDVVYLQSGEPLMNAEYVLITPKQRKFHIDVKHPGLERSVKTAGDQRIHRFFAREVPEVRGERHMAPWPELMGFVHVSTYRSWKDLGQWYWGLVRDQLDLDDATRKLAREITKDAKTDLDKVKAVYGWVVKNTRYVALEFGIEGLRPRRCVQTVARGWGDCKDKATVIVSMLKELGIDATLVIVRTQMRGDFRSELPSFAPYDHVIAYVPSLNLYLDGTAEFHGATELPRMDLGALAIHVNQGDAKRVYLPEGDPKQNVIQRRVQAKLKPDGSAELEIAYETRGVAAPEWRAQFHSEATRRDRLSQAMGSEFRSFTIREGASGIVTGDLEDIEQPVKIRIRGTAPGFGRREGNQLSMSVTNGLRLASTYASLARRRQDLRILGFSTLRDTFVVKLPAGMKVDTAPPNASGETKFGSYSVKVEQSPGQVTVTSEVSVRVSRIKPQDYVAWKRFCVAADQALSPRLVVGP